MPSADTFLYFFHFFIFKPLLSRSFFDPVVSSPSLCSCVRLVYLCMSRQRRGVCVLRQLVVRDPVPDPRERLPQELRGLP